MAIADRISAMYDHIGNIYDTLELGGDTTENKNIVNINAEIKREYKDFLAHGTDTLWNNWEKVSGTGTIISLTRTIKAKMKVDLKGNTQQNGTPTPSSPIPVQVVSGDNTIKVEGKNLFDKSTITENKYLDINGVEQNDNTKCYSDYIAINSNNNYITNQMGNWGGVCTCYYDTNKTFISAETGTTIVGNNNIFTIPSNAYYMRVSTNKSWLDITQIELGNQATPYQPYQSATYPISLGNIELCKIGTYQDSIVKDNGKWYLNKQIVKITLSNSDNFVLDSYSQRFTKVLDTTYEQEGYSNRYIYGSTYQTTGKFEILSNGKLAFNYPSSNIDTVAKLQTYLTTNELYMYFPLSNPTTTEITDTTLLSQLEALKEAESYLGQTNISQVNDDMPFILDITALKEI